MSDYVVAGSRVTIDTTIVERLNGTTAAKDLSAGGITVDCLTKVDTGTEQVTACTLTDAVNGVVSVTIPSAKVTEGRKMRLQWRINSAGDPLKTKPITLPVL